MFYENGRSFVEAFKQEGPLNNFLEKKLYPFLKRENFTVVPLNIMEVYRDPIDLIEDTRLYRHVRGNEEGNNLLLFPINYFTMGGEFIEMYETNYIKTKNFIRECRKIRFEPIEEDEESHKFFDIVKKFKNKNKEEIFNLLKLNEEGKAYIEKNYENISIKGDIYLITTAVHNETNRILNFLFKLHMVYMCLSFITKKRIGLKDLLKYYKEEILDNFLNSIPTDYRKKLKELEEDISSLRTAISEKMILSQPIEFFLNNIDTFKDKIREDLDKARKIEGIKDVYIDNGNVIIETGHIYIPTGGEYEYWDIGKLVFNVTPEGKVFCKNLTRGRKGYRNIKVGHPHVIDPNGLLCLGNIENIVLEFMQSHDYSSLALILLNFGKSVNLSDPAGKTIISWPIVQL